MLQKQYHGCINLGTGTGVSVGAIATTLGAQLSASKLVNIPSPKAKDEAGDVIADASRLKQLGWRPSVDIEQGLSRLIKHLNQTSPVR
jgi:nucleoside-diphosphate-sugar epimerase